MNGALKDHVFVNSLNESNSPKHVPISHQNGSSSALSHVARRRASNVHTGEADVLGGRMMLL